MENWDQGEKKCREGLSMNTDDSLRSLKLINLLKRFLGIQQKRAEAYTNLHQGFSEYMVNGADLAYQQLCAEITVVFSDCSKQILEMESLLMHSDLCRGDLAGLLKDIQEQEKQKLQLTAQIQVLKKAGRPSERLVSHENCCFRSPTEHECVHIHPITEADGVRDAEADAEYDAALKEAIRGVQSTVTAINEHLEEVRYEIEALESEQLEELIEKSESIQIC